MNYDDDAYELQLLQWLLLQHAVAALAAWHCFGCSPVDHESASAPSGLRRPSRRNQYEILNQIFSFGGKSKDLPFVTESFPAKFWIFPRAYTAASRCPPFPRSSALCGLPADGVCLPAECRQWQWWILDFGSSYHQVEVNSTIDLKYVCHQSGISPPPAFRRIGVFLHGGRPRRRQRR